MLNKAKSYKDRIKKNPKLFLILVLGTLLVILVFFVPFGKKVSFEIEDKCGRFVNLASHTIETQSQCKTRCRNQCESQKMAYTDVAFHEIPSSCNNCTCYCRGKTF